MITIVVAGMGKERMAQLVEQAGAGRIEAISKTDLEAAMAVKSGTAAYYIGACQSGAGGALGVANAILGSGLVVRLSGVGTTADPDDVRAAVAAGKKAFGISVNQIDAVVPVLVGAILAARE
jgi:hypothetical protein